MRQHRSILIASALLTSGCGGYFPASSKKGFEATELKRAAFDLQCPAEQVEVTELADGSIDLPADSEGTVIGVRGCGKQATYKYFKDRGWVSQSAR